MKFASDFVSGKPNELLRRHLAGILDAAVRAVDPDRAVRRFVRVRGATMRIGRRTYDLSAIHRIIDPS